MCERLLMKNVPAFAPCRRGRSVPQRPRWRAAAAATAAQHLTYRSALIGTLMIQRVLSAFLHGSGAKGKIDLEKGASV